MLVRFSLKNPRRPARIESRRNQFSTERRVRAEVPARLEAIAERAVPIIRVRATGDFWDVDAIAVDRGRREREAVDEVEAEEEGKPEDEDQDRGGPPMRAEPASAVIQERTNLREVAPMMDRLFRHCRTSDGRSRFPWDSMGGSDLGTPVGRAARWS